MAATLEYFMFSFGRFFNFVIDFSHFDPMTWANPIYCPLHW